MVTQPSLFLLTGLMLSVLASAPATGQPAEPLAVFVTTTADPAPPKPDKKATRDLEHAMDSARQVRTATVERLERLHGGDQKKWPAAAHDELETANTVAALASARFAFRDPKTRGKLADSANDFAKAVGGAGLTTTKRRNFVVGPDRDAAHLVVTMLARRSGLSSNPDAILDDQFWLWFRIEPGPALGGGQSGSFPPRHVWLTKTPPLSRPSADAQRWELEVFSGISWRMVATEATVEVDRFIEENRALLAGR